MVSQVWDHPVVYCIPVELPHNPLRVLNSYVIQTPERNLILDTGFNRPECRTALWSGIQALELDLSKTALFLTHLHSDHIGLVWDFVSRGVPVYMGQLEYRYFSKLQHSGGMAALDPRFHEEGCPMRELKIQYQENQGRRYAPQPDFPATLLDDGSRIENISIEMIAIETPGHTPGHMVLYLPKEQLLFAGDHILFDITPNIGVWAGVPNSLSDYLESLQKIRRLSIQAAFPAHRARQSDVYARIDALIEHHGQRLNEIYHAVENNPSLTAYKIAEKITWSARGLGWAQFSPHQKWFAMSETMAHLDYLVDKGRLSRLKKYGYVTYNLIKE